MVGTEIGAVEPGIVRRQQLDQATLHGLVSSRVVQAARDPRLVGDGDHEPARLIQLMNRLARACEQTDFAGLVEESRALHDGSVPVQEDGAAAGVSHRARSAPRASRPPARRGKWCVDRDRKSTRLNSSHITTSYAVFCLKKKSDTRTSRLCL